MILEICVCVQDEKSVVSCSDEARHNFESGDYVTFREVEVRQMSYWWVWSLNGCAWAQDSEECVAVKGKASSSPMKCMFSSSTQRPLGFGILLKTCKTVLMS